MIAEDRCEVTLFPDKAKPLLGEWAKESAARRYLMLAFEVAICLALGRCPVCNETHNALRSNPSSIDSCGIIAVPGDARLRRLVGTGDAGRRLVGWR